MQVQLHIYKKRLLQSDQMVICLEESRRIQHELFQDMILVMMRIPQMMFTTRGTVHGQQEMVMVFRLDDVLLAATRVLNECASYFFYFVRIHYM